MTESADSQGPNEQDGSAVPEAPVSEPTHAIASSDASSSDEPAAAAAEPAGGEEAAGEDGEHEQAEAEGGEGEGENKGKKKRRRRRKKRKGEEGEGQQAEGGAPPRPRKDTSHLPFQRFFEQSPRRHAFAVGEIVAGRVLKVEGDVASVDLFGKAIAFARANEPRDIPIEAIHPEPEEPAEAEAAQEAAPEPQAEAHTDVVSDTPSEAGQTAAPHDEGEDDKEEAAQALPADVPEPAYKTKPEGIDPINAGEIMRGRVGAVAESGHIALVNQAIDAGTTRQFLAHARNARTRVDGLVFGFNRGGFDVLICGLRAFCPIGGMSLDVVEEPESLLGQWAQFHIQTAKAGSQGLVVSRRSILEKESRKHARQFLKTLQPGQRVKGRVTQVREYGLFVDIGGVEGLVHQSELAWERGVRPSDVAKPGDEIEVQIREVHEAQSKRERHERVSLSLKALAPDPWDQHEEALTEGVPRKGTVVRTAEFGAFVQLVPGIDGLLHISELGKDLKHASDAVSEGDELFVVIERIDRKQRRISLSKLTAEDAAAFEEGKLSGEAVAAIRLKVGGHAKVKVVQVVPAGLQVQVEGVLGKRGRGFIPNAEMGTPRGTDHRKGWPVGTEVDVKIIGVDRDGGMRCSRKGFLVDEERRAVRDYRKEAAKQGFGTFGDLLRSKLGTSKEGGA